MFRMLPDYQPATDYRQLSTTRFRNVVPAWVRPHAYIKLN